MCECEHVLLFALCDGLATCPQPKWALANPVTPLGKRMYRPLTDGIFLKTEKSVFHAVLLSISDLLKMN